MAACVGAVVAVASGSCKASSNLTPSRFNEAASFSASMLSAFAMHSLATNKFSSVPPARWLSSSRKRRMSTPACRSFVEYPDMVVGFINSGLGRERGYFKKAQKAKTKQNYRRASLRTSLKKHAGPSPTARRALTHFAEGLGQQETRLCSMASANLEREASRALSCLQRDLPRPARSGVFSIRPSLDETKLIDRTRPSSPARSDIWSC